MITRIGLVDGAWSYARWFLSSLRNSRFGEAGRPLIVVTGSDTSHYLSQVQFLESLSRFEPEATVVMWDLGLTEQQVQRIRQDFPNVHYRAFPYRDFPSYFLVTRSKGEYAWKPVAIQKTAEEFGPQVPEAILLWCDAGNVIFRKLKWLRRYVGKNVVFTPFSRGTLRDWTHPATIQYFGLTESELLRSNCASGFVGFDLKNEQSWSVLNWWAELALQRQVFAPKGSSRANHRQDQAVLGCILVKEGILSDGSFRTNWTEEYLTGQDIDKSGGVRRSTRPPLRRRILGRAISSLYGTTE